MPLRPSSYQMMVASTVRRAEDTRLIYRSLKTLEGVLEIAASKGVRPSPLTLGLLEELRTRLKDSGIDPKNGGDVENPF